jgi:molecular chaperone GrpE
MMQDLNEPADSSENRAEPGKPQSPGQGDGGQEHGSVEAGPSEVESLRNELEKVKDKYLRALAEWQNGQKRAAAERRDAARHGQADLAKALLPVLDNLERTLQATRSATDIKVIADGVRIVYEQLLKILGEFGLQRMEPAEGDPFDPKHHQAVAHHPTDRVEPEHIIQVAQAGYTMRDMILRPATVVVAKRVSPAAEPATEGQAPSDGDTGE